MVLIGDDVHRRERQGRISHREVTIPEKNDPKFRQWKAKNHMVMSWLINSMNNEIGENFLLYGTTKEVWDAARVTYLSSENTSELFQIEAILHDLRQGDLTVTQYFNTSLLIGNSICLKFTHGSALKTPPSIRRLWSKNGRLNFFSAPTKNWISPTKSDGDQTSPRC